MSDQTCGSTDTTSGEPCGFPVPQPKCPFHGEGEPPDNGRPTEYTEERATYICQEIRKGRSLKSICREEEMPSAGAVILWASEDREGFADRYARACSIRLDVLSEELIEISDDSRNDSYVDEEGREHVNYDHIQRSKLRVDTRKWLLSKLRPEKYGKRQKLEHSGEVDTGGDVHVYLPSNDRDSDSLPEQLKKRQEAVSSNGK